MADITLVAETGRPTGSRSSRRLRGDGRIPAVVYGTGVDAISVTVGARDLRNALSTAAGLNAVLTLDVNGATYPTLARELQRHPVKGTLVHVDFLVVDLNIETSAEVPITLTGDAIEVHRADGVVDQQMFSLTVQARPADIPPHFDLDVSELTVGASLRVADLTLPAGVSTEVDPETVVVAGQAARVTLEPEEAEAVEGEEGAEGAAETPAESAETSSED